MAGIRALKQNRLWLGLGDRWQNRLQRHVVRVRPFVVAPAEVHPHAVGGNVAERVVEGFNLHFSITHKFGVVYIAEFDVAAHRQIGAVNLQNQASGVNRFVFDFHHVRQRLQIIFVRFVILIGLENGDDARRGGVHKPFFDACRRHRCFSC